MDVKPLNEPLGLQYLPHEQRYPPYMRIKKLIFVLFLFLPTILFSQSKTAALHGDCQNAVEIEAVGKYAFKNSPNGHGKVLEIQKNSMRSKYFFTQENHSAWFTFTASTTSSLSFYIQPKDTLADFDFLLFEYTDANFCTDVSSRKIKPIRSNISRFDPKVKSMTGLSDKGESDLVPSGPGNHFSNSVNIIKGKKYYLVINLANDVTTPFRIVFANKKVNFGPVLITGTLKDENNEKVIKGATITAENESGKFITETTSNSKTGSFSLNIPEEYSGTKVIISAEKEGYLFLEKTLSPNQMVELEPLEIVIPKLKKGRHLNMHNILFVGNEATVLPTSKSSLNRLYRLVNKNPSLKIQIAGHTNGCGNGNLFSQKLSNDRANKVKKFLVSRGISANRITTIGYGCKKMLYPITAREQEQALNRRVEILVTDF